MRLEKLLDWLQKSTLDALIVDDPVDILYLTGLHLSLGRLVLTKHSSRLFVDGRYLEAAQKQEVCPVELTSQKGIRLHLKGCKIIGFDSHFLSVDAFEMLKKEFADVDWVSVSRPLKQLRCVKDEKEINSLRKAARLTYLGYKEIVSHLKEGVEEQELAFLFEQFCRKKGASGLSFSPIIAFGENSAYPHHRAGKTRLKKDQIVLIDVGAIVDDYRGDMTRTLFFGEADPELYQVFLAVRRAQKKAVVAIRPGIEFGTLDRIARQSLAQEKMEHLFTHGLSHGIGLETHEFPSLKIEGGERSLVLEPGMVFTVEPGVYIPHLGGVRYEDTVLVTSSGVENFYPDH